MSLHSMEMASKVLFQDVREYLKARNWVSSPSKRDYAAIFRSPSGDYEALIPLDRTLGDYSRAMLAAASQIGLSEQRAATQVLRDLLMPRYDTLRFTVDGDGGTRGSIPLQDGESLIVATRKALLASACSVKRPRKYHPRMSLAEADAFVKACVLGQTEIGSFVLTVDAPLEIDDQIDSEVPFGRRTSEHLLRATGALAESIRKDELSSIVDVPDEDARVSANLCDALLSMFPKDEGSDIEISGSWSPHIPSSAHVPSRVTIDRDMYETIEVISDRLRPSAGTATGSFVGLVSELAGIPNDTGRVEGQVTMLVVHDNEIISARAILGPEDYQKAAEAHLHAKFVLLRAKLHRGRRLNRLEAVTEFSRLET